jgi:hypothetical protein
VAFPVLSVRKCGQFAPVWRGQPTRVGRNVKSVAKPPE